MSNCPTRWASVIELNTRWARPTGRVLADDEDEEDDEDDEDDDVRPGRDDEGPADEEDMDPLEIEVRDDGCPTVADDVHAPPTTNETTQPTIRTRRTMSS